MKEEPNKRPEPMSMLRTDMGSSLNVSRKESLAIPPPQPKFSACRQQSRSAKVSSRRPSSWCVAFLRRPPGMTSCIASTSGRRSTPDSRTSAPVTCTRTRRFGKNSWRRDDWLILRGSALASGDSPLYRPGFRVLCGAHGCSPHRTRGTGRDCSRTRSPGA